MIELFNELAIVGDAIYEEDRVVYLLASLPDFNTLVSALEANEDVPKMEVVTEKLLHAERKQTEKSSPDSSGDKAMMTRRQFRGRGPQCYYCRQYGHVQKNCTKQPEGFVEEGKEHLLCKLKQSLYGLKQSPRCWNYTLDAHLKSMGYVQSTSDPCIYTSAEGETSIIGVYVDDFVIAAETTEKIKEIKTALSQKFEVKDLGELHYFLDHPKPQKWHSLDRPTNFH